MPHPGVLTDKEDKKTKKMEKSMDKLSIFAPFIKADEDQRMVWGYASTEALDSQGEVVEKEAITKALPDYMKFGNIREMHQPSAVGKTKQADIDERGLFIKVKVVDDNAWSKVKEGVYNGFSIGGRAVMKVGNKIKDLVLSEISLVDRPANPEALITVVKFDDNGEVTNKSSDMEEVSVEAFPGEEKYKEISDFMNRQVAVIEVGEIIQLAEHLIYMIADRIWEEKSYSDLESALDSLKAAAKTALGEDQEKAMSEKMDEIIELVKTQKDNPEAYAYVSKDGMKHLPIATDSLIKASLRNFHETNFHDNDHRILAARILKASAEALEIPVKDVMLIGAAETPMQYEIEKEYTPVYRESNYFNIMKGVVG